MSNEEILKTLRIRKILKYILILTSISTIVLAILALTIKLSPIYCVISFIIEMIVKVVRERYPIRNSK